MGPVTDLHRYVAYFVPAAFLVLALWAGLAFLRNKDVRGGFWGLLGVVQAVLGLQILVGIVLFATGRRAVAGGFWWLHYVYGGVFPLAVLVFAHTQARKRPGIASLIFGGWCLVAFGLTFRALQTALGWFT